MNAQVVCHVRSGVTLTFKLKEKEVVLGRDPQIGVNLPVEGVSRQHARVRWDGKSYWLEDLKSTNGTFLNGQPAVRERLRHLDVIGLGREVDLIFLLRSPEAAAAAAAARQGIVKAVLVPEGEAAAPIEVAPGEITLGRAPSNNVVADSSAVSKVHARIERTLDQLVLEDLGSANGTYVNGARVMTAFLQDGDVLSLAGVETFRVSIETGAVKGFGSSARMRVPVSAAERQRFSADWKTRFDWDSGEREALEELRQQIREREKAREAQRERTKKVDVVKPPGHPARAVQAAKPAAKPAAPAPAAAKPPAPAPAAAKPAPEPAKPAPAAPPKAAPAPAPPPAAPSPKPPAPPAKPVPPAAAPPAAAPASEPLAAPPPAVSKPAAPAPPPAPPPRPQPPPSPPVMAPPRPAPAPPVAVMPPPARARPPASPPVTPPPAPAAQPSPTKAGVILEVRLVAEGYDLVAREPGAHELGRAADAALRVNHPTVSRKHARVILADDRGIAYLQDAGGANGTRLNGQAIEKLAPLSDGDRVGVGEVELTVVLKRA
jgi:pSer/pThr/pTyr-binding forkhead associated (FHA) protein